MRNYLKSISAQVPIIEHTFLPSPPLEPRVKPELILLLLAFPWVGHLVGSEFASCHIIFVMQVIINP